MGHLGSAYRKVKSACSCRFMWKARHATSASLQQAEFSGFQSCLSPIAHPQLAQNVAEVVLDGATGDVEGLADLAIGSPTRQQGQDLPLALGQLRPVAPADERGSGGSDHGGLDGRSEEHTSELQSRVDLVCRLLL